jgi:hypothetical protein
MDLIILALFLRIGKENEAYVGHDNAGTMSYYALGTCKAGEAII